MIHTTYSDFCLQFPKVHFWLSGLTWSDYVKIWLTKQ